MLKLFKRKKRKNTDKTSDNHAPVISAPIPLTPSTNDISTSPTNLEQESSPPSASKGTQADFSPVRTKPSLLAYVDDQTSDLGYSVVRDAITLDTHNVPKRKHARSVRNRPLPQPPSSDEDMPQTHNRHHHLAEHGSPSPEHIQNNSSLTSVTSDEHLELDDNYPSRKSPMLLAENDQECLNKIIPQDTQTIPIYAKVKKEGKLNGDQGRQSESKKSDRREGGSGKGDRREGGSGNGDRREGGSGNGDRREGGSGKGDRREGGSGKDDRREGGSGKGNQRESESGKGSKKTESENRKYNGKDGSRRKHVQERDDGIHFKINTGVMKSKHVTPQYPVTNNQRPTKHSTSKASTPMEEEDSSESCSLSEELPEFDSDEEDYHTTSIAHSSSFPSHRPPPKPSPRQQGSSSHHSRPSSTPLQGLADLPVYSLNQSMPLASGDQAYLLTRTRPDGSMEHFTATVLSPVVSPTPPFYHHGSLSPFPEEPTMHKSKSIPFITTSTPMRDKPLPRSQSVHQSVLHPTTEGYDCSLSATRPLTTSHHPNVSTHSPSLDQSKNHIPVRPDVPGVNTKHKHVHRKQGWSDTLEANAGHKTYQSSYTNKTTEIDNSLHEENAALKESMIQMTAELSLHSLPGDKDENLSFEGESPEQLLHRLPQRLRNVLRALSESLAEKDVSLQTYQYELTKLKEDQDKLRIANESLLEISKHQDETNQREKQLLHQSLSEVKKEKEHLLILLDSVNNKIRDMKREHKIKMNKLTTQLQQLSRERDSVRQEIITMQRGHLQLQKRLKQYHHHHNPSSTVNNISLSEHKKSLQEFESLLKEVMHSSSTNNSPSQTKQIDSLRSENLSLVSQLTEAKTDLLSIKEECTKLQRNNRDNEERLLLLQSELQQARARELAIVNELSQAVTSIELERSMSPTTLTRCHKTGRDPHRSERPHNCCHFPTRSCSLYDKTK